MRVVETSRSRSASERGTGFLTSRDAQTGCCAYISETATEPTWSPASVSASVICFRTICTGEAIFAVP